jgi:hypothetical protein
MGRLRLIYCRDCGAKLDAFGICPNASAQDVRISHGIVQCGEGRYSTPLEVWSVLSACASNDPAISTITLIETRVSIARSGPPGSIAA